MNAEKLAEVFGDTRASVRVADLIKALTDSTPDPYLVSSVSIGNFLSDVPKIGDVWEGQGGVYAGVMRGENGPDYHLIVPPNAFVEKIEWGGYGKEEVGAVSEFDGLKNTQALVASPHAHPAAEWAFGLEIGGLKDFYLPARREQSLLYANVPELFDKVYHWSSTQYSAGSAWVQYFGNGYQGDANKGYGCRGVAVRRLVL